MLPLVLIGAAAMLGGAKKMVDGRSAAKRAATISEDATVRLRAAQERLDKAVKQGERAFARLDKVRADARAMLVDDVAYTLRRVAGVDDRGFTDLKEALARPERLAVAIGVKTSPILHIILLVLTAGGAVWFIVTKADNERSLVRARAELLPELDRAFAEGRYVRYG